MADPKESNALSLYHMVVVALLALLVGSQLTKSPLPPPPPHLHDPLSSFKCGCNNASSNYAAPKTRFTHEDFSSHFGLTYLVVPQVDPLIAEFVKNHDIGTDTTYQNDAKDSDRWAQHMAEIFENGLPDDKRFYIQFVSQKKGYGLFADVPVGPRQVVALYTGMITNSSLSDYQWDYPSKVLDNEGNELSLGIDSRFAGNWARFVNHADDPNVDSIYIPYKGLWHVVYMSNRWIAKDEEVTISYGEAYWTSRATEKV